MAASGVLRILHVYKDYYPIVGGIENHIKTLAELQCAAGHQVTVLVTNPGGQAGSEVISGVQLLRAGRIATVASTPLSLALPLKLRSINADITHLHFPYPIGEIGQWLFRRRRPYVITYHSDVVRQRAMLLMYAPIMRRVLSRANRILPTSAPYIATSPYLRDLQDHCTVTPLSVDPLPFLKATPLLPPAEKPRLLFVGRHRYYKGIATLLQAMPQVDAELMIAGDGPMRARWEQMARELNLGARVTFLGEVSDEDLPRLYAAAGVFILPANARAEAFGTVLLEAMAAGLPCVTTEVGSGTSYVVQDGITGLVVPPLQPLALAEALNRLLSNPELCVQMGTAGRARVVQEFSPAALLQRVTAVYQSVLSANPDN